MRLLRGLHIDVPLLIALLTVITAGLFILYSASGEDLDAVGRQVIRLGIAFAVMVTVAQVSPQTLRRWTPRVFVFGVLLLIAVLVIGEIGKGAQRWLDLGIVRFQPSELMKLAVPMMIAWYLAETSLPPRPLHLFVSLVLIGVPFVLVAKQPDLGTSLLIASAGFFTLFLAGLRWRILAGGLLLVLAMAYPVWHYVLHDYQRMRVLTFLNPERDPLGAGYHIIQSVIAVGSGGMYGKGWLNGTQSQLDFLPERHTDFIFAVISEEFGLFGVLLLLALYTFIVVRGLYIALQAQDTYSRLLAGSLSLTFFVYVFVNTGMVIGLLPVVGLPLPLISYGGTSMVTLMAGFGMLMSIHTHRKLLSP
ncbi:MAG: rod shape-determining protein RodA [Gammaproteobacteria bacterium]